MNHFKINYRYLRERADTLIEGEMKGFQLRLYDFFYDSRKGTYNFSLTKKMQAQNMEYESSTPENEWEYNRFERSRKTALIAFILLNPLKFMKVKSIEKKCEEWEARERP